METQHVDQQHGHTDRGFDSDILEDQGLMGKIRLKRGLNRG